MVIVCGTTLNWSNKDHTYDMSPDRYWPDNSISLQSSQQPDRPSPTQTWGHARQGELASGKRADARLDPAPLRGRQLSGEGHCFSEHDELGKQIHHGLGGECR